MESLLNVYIGNILGKQIQIRPPGPDVLLFAPKALFRCGGCTGIVNIGLCSVKSVEVFEPRFKKPSSSFELESNFKIFVMRKSQLFGVCRRIPGASPKIPCFRSTSGEIPPLIWKSFLSETHNVLNLGFQHVD
jgi:hypothetical protein